MRVLIRDDDAAVGRLVCRIAVAAGFEPATTLSGAEFRSQFQAELPDVIVLDLRIGDTDGVEELRFLNSKAYPNALILASGFDHRVLSTAETLAQSLGLTVVAALPKPFHPAALQHVFERVKAEADSPAAEQLHEAIAKNQLVLEYQPIVTRRDGAVRALEALLRWNHPKQGRLLPDRFMPSAERTPKVLDAVTDWVVTTAIEQYKELRHSALVTPMSVNVSGKSLNAIDFPDRLSARLGEAQIPSGHFCLEITESAVARDPVRTMEILSRLRLKGIDLAIDDFGTGHWSLTRFRQLPFSIIKIAHSFIRDMKKSGDAMKTIEAYLELAKEWEIETIAEGVDTEEAAARLIASGVAALQGPLISAPMPARQVAVWLRQWSARSSPAQLRTSFG